MQRGINRIGFVTFLLCAAASGLAPPRSALAEPVAHGDRAGGTRMHAKHIPTAQQLDEIRQFSIAVDDSVLADDIRAFFRKVREP